MRFGLFIPQGWRHDLVGIDPADQWAVMRGIAQRADAGPWESLWVYDHFHTVPAPTEEATHEAWSLMAAFAASTSRIRLGQMCTCMSYRNPGHLAKVAATIDIVSGGRVEMGIGAGWYEHEWRAYGYGFPPIKERLGRLREGVEVFRQAWTTGYATLDGEHYTFDGARFFPQPLQQNTLSRIPMWVAGGGEKVTLRIAAEYASYTNFGGDLETFAAKSAILEQHCADLGRDFASITRSANYNILLADSEAELDERLAAMHARVLPALGEEVADRFIAEYRSPSALGVGTVEQVVERFRALQDAGLGYVIAYFPGAAYSTSDLDRFEREIIPALA